MIGRRRSVWEEEEEEEEEDRRERKKWKEISVRGSALQSFTLEKKNNWDTYAVMSKKFPVSSTKKTLIETRQVNKFTREKCKPLVAQALKPPHVAKQKIHIPSNIVQAAFNEVEGDRC